MVIVDNNLMEPVDSDGGEEPMLWEEGMAEEVMVKMAMVEMANQTETRFVRIDCHCWRLTVVSLVNEYYNYFVCACPCQDGFEDMLNGKASKNQCKCDS